ncbi:MAG: guanylate kinase [Fidelibacterota bacterium]|nr:MAG: guanylate kinase [Candidatus Neomarinimicrobiota bacterium]
MRKGLLVVISAPSGVGKTTICKQLMAAHPDWRFSVSVTTRPPRFDETNEKDYTFISNELFEKYISDGKLAEWELVHGHRYGTLRSTLEEVLDKGEILLLEVDVKGGANIKRQFPDDTIAVFIDPPDLETLIQRLEDRGTESQAVMEQRLARIPEEQAYKKNYDYVVVNDDLERAVNAVEKAIMEVK